MFDVACFTQIVPQAVSLSPDHLTIIKTLDHGSFATVSLGSYTTSPSETNRVAIKSFHASADDRENSIKSQMALDEMNIMSRLKHQYIIDFYGYIAAPEKIQLAIEYMDNRTLWHFIGHADYTLRKGMYYARQIAEALVYLHTQFPVIVHRDIKSENVLLNSQNVAKLGDFGLACKAGRRLDCSGSMGWLAPEIIRERKYSAASDVYAFGVLMWELLSRQSPQKDNQPILSIEAILLGYHLPISADCPASFKKLLGDCWHVLTYKRIKAQQIVEQLLSEIEDNPGSSLQPAAGHHPSPSLSVASARLQSPRGSRQSSRVASHNVSFFSNSLRVAPLNSPAEEIEEINAPPASPCMMTTTAACVTDEQEGRLAAASVMPEV